jgi:hypothetical protein
MMKKPVGPAVNAHVIELAEKCFSTSGEAREAIRKAINEISDEQLLKVRGIHVLIMA